MSSLSESSIVAGASASTVTPAHTVNQSIRFDSTERAYITEDTAGSVSFSTTATVSMWVKKAYYANQGTRNMIWGAFYGSNARYDAMQFQSDDSLEFNIRSGGASTSTGSGQVVRRTNQKFKDPHAWYNIVTVIDSTNTVQQERLNFYVNGNKITDWHTNNNVSSGQLFYTMADGVEQNIGAYQDNDYGSSYNYLYFDGYIAEIVFIDGTAYGPENFGEFTSAGIWRPVDPSDLTFGTNGFYYKGQNSSNLAEDSSGNGNDGAVVNLTAQDQVLDTPTNNFCVLNSVDKLSYDSGATVRGVREANLALISKPTGNVNGYARGNMPVTSGKWYYEVYTTTYPGGEAIGIGWQKLENAQTATTSGSGWDDFGINQRHTSSAYTSWKWGTNESTATGLTPFGQGVVIGVYTDFDSNLFMLHVDGSSYGSVDFDSTSPTQDLTDGSQWLPVFDLANDQSAQIQVNFGQDDSFNAQKTSSSAAASDANGFGKFYYDPNTGGRSGYLALCSRNLGA